MTTIGRVKVIDVPDYFLERYDAEIGLWASNFQKIGPVKSFILREGWLAAPSPNEEQGRVMIQVKLWARMSRAGVELSPYRERDKVLIALHCEKMMRAGVPARMKLVEPPRPGIPFMPRIKVPS